MTADDRYSLAILGTSNSLMKNGVSSALGEHFKVTNYSLGASSSALGLYRISCFNEILSSDFILLDYSINDEEHLSKEWVSPEVFRGLLRELYSILALSGARVGVLLMPAQKFCGKSEKSIGVRLHRDMANEFGFTIFDGYAFVENMNLENFGLAFMDPAHLSRENARGFGQAVAGSLLANGGPDSSRNSREAIIRLREFSQCILPDRMLHDGTSEIKGTSIERRECVTIVSGQSIFVEELPGFRVEGFLANPNSRAKISINCDHGKIVKDVYSGNFDDSLTMLKYYPVLSRDLKGCITVKIEPYDTPITEASPKSKKVLSPENYGKFDLFGILYTKI